jgi:hypothetical protein
VDGVGGTVPDVGVAGAEGAGGTEEVGAGDVGGVVERVGVRCGVREGDRLGVGEGVDRLGTSSTGSGVVGSAGGRTKP